MNELWTYASFYLVILIPNLFRQMIYYFAYKKTGKSDFIVSFETKKIYAKKKKFLGFVEEGILGLIFTYLWFNFVSLGFLVFGWLADAIQDALLTCYWMKKKKMPYEYVLGKDSRVNFVFREIIIPYLFFGPVLFLLGADIFTFLIIIFSLDAFIMLYLNYFVK